MSQLLAMTLKNFTHTRMDEPPVKLNKYPHLIGGDHELWDKFQIKYPDFFEAVSYDVRVGEGMVINGDWERNIQEMAKTLSQRRIDLIGERQNKIWLVEIKVDPSVSLIGQLDAYLILFMNELENHIKIELMTIVNRVSPDLITVLNRKNIKYYIV